MKTQAKIFGATVVMAAASACGGTDERGVCTSSAGNICTIAGLGENGYSGDEGPALEARLSLPQDVLFGDDGTIYVLDWNNHRIRRITPDGIIHHFAGRREPGVTSDDPLNSDFNHPTGLIFDYTRTKIIVAAWHNSKIREIDLATGEITDTCGDGRRGYFGDGGEAATAVLDLPASLAFDPKGDLIVMDQANQVLRRIDEAGKIHRFAGQCVIDRAAPDGPGPCSEGTLPVACAAPSGKLTCGDPAKTCMLPCTPSYAGDDGPAMEMRIAQPFGQSADPAGRIAFDPGGRLYFSDTSNAVIRMIDLGGNVHRVAGLPPSGGAPARGYSGDGGPALEAKLNNPVDLAVAENGTIYFTDVYNHCVRAIDPSGTIDTVAGVCGTPGSTGDGGPARAALLKRPYGIELAGDILYIADTGNNRIRTVALR